MVSLYIQRTNFKESGSFLTKALNCVFENIMSRQQKLYTHRLWEENF